ncbi:MAG: amidohydrolase family protein [Halobacteriales archaeon]
MQSEYDLLVTNASLNGNAATVDIGITDGVIKSIEADIPGDADQVIDANGNFVSPGLVDCHLHIDRAFSSVGERKPVGWEQSATAKDYNRLFNEYYKDISAEELERKATKNVRRAVKYGTTHMRSHVCVDHPSGLTNMEACLETYENTADIVDLQLAVMPSKGIVNDESFDLVEGAVRRGVERTSPESILVGGVDPASRNQDVEETIRRWFDIATTYDVGIDVHIQDGGTVGIHTLEQLIEKTKTFEYEGRVTASHCFSLAHIPEFRRLI